MGSGTIFQDFRKSLSRKGIDAAATLGHEVVNLARWAVDEVPENGSGISDDTAVIYLEPGAA